MKKRRLKKGVIVFLILFMIIPLILVGTYFYSISSVSKQSEVVSFTVQSGSSKIRIIEELKNARLIRSKYALLTYLFFHDDLNLQAGKYELDRNMNAVDILKKISGGKVLVDTVKVTFVEGKNMNDYIKVISNNFPYTEAEIKEVLASKEFTKELVEKYDFLTDEVLSDNIYYALEGYLFPDTYQFKGDVTIKEIFIKILDNTKVKLETVDLTNTEYTVHEILTLASIIELEASKEEDRPVVSQVFYNRLAKNMNLGSDITTYYAAKKELGEKLTNEDLELINPYNTRKLSAGKLPIGPVCNPSLSSINAALKPSGDNNYLYFVANTCTKEIFYFENLLDHSKKSRELRSICATN